MNFIMTTDDEGNRKLWANKSNTPKELLKREDTIEFEVPMDKDGLMGVLQQFLDQINEAPQMPDREDGIEETITDVMVIPSIEPDKEMTMREFLMLMTEWWDLIPLASKLHYGALGMEDARVLLDPSKYQKVS